MSGNTKYFGSENVVDTLKEGLNPTLTGLSKEQHFGSGFYFFEYDSAAQNEIGLQGLKVAHPVVMSGDVTLSNPIRLPQGTQSIRDAQIDITPEQVHQMMHKNERIFDSVFSPLMEWKGGDHHRISEELINDVCTHFAKPENFWDMEKQLFGDMGEAALFREAVTDVLGYDGVIIELGNGKENMVAWSADQVSNFEIYKVLPKPEAPEQKTRPPEPVVPELKLSRLQ